MSTHFPWVRQRTDEDCGCAALAMLLGLTYEDVADAWRASLGREPSKSSYADLARVAAYLGRRLAKARTSKGIRRVRPEPRTRHSHWVVVADEWIYCPTRGIYHKDHYPWQAWGSGLELR